MLRITLFSLVLGSAAAACASTGDGDIFGRTSCDKLRTQCQQNQSAADFFGGEVSETNRKNAEACWARFKAQCGTSSTAASSDS
ncbi:MAG: hypothetical protein AAF627_09100 [Myxococcota bacterium]